MIEENKPLLYSVEGSVARITLNRPEKRNALNEALIAAVKGALREADGNEGVRAIVITGAGGDFCAGADLSSLQKISAASVAENVDDAHSLMELFVLIRQVKVPVVAAVPGKALAGGCGLATACDLVLASTTARFGYPEVKIGFVPAMVMAMLRRNVSEKRAFELITLGGEIAAAEAKQFGLVNQVFSEVDFETEVTSYVRVFERMSKSAVALAKTLLYQIDGLPFLEALETGLDTNVIARTTADSRERIERFLTKS